MHPDSQALSPQLPAKYLRLGPLAYALVPHDDWGHAIVAAIARNFPLADTEPAPVDRVIHLRRETRENDAVTLPFPAQSLSAIAPEAAGTAPWQRLQNRMNTVWVTAQSHHSLWTAAADDDLAPLRFHLPWTLLLRDLATCGGGVIHAGTAVHDRRAWLFLAPPGGGKTTTLATAPPGWAVPSDDAALLWPGADGHWLVAPLPSWSLMISAPQPRERSPRWGQDPVRLAGLLALNKADKLHYTRLSAATAAAALYRALNEYPPLLFAGHTEQERFFRCAGRLARELPCWRLDLPLGADLWSDFPPAGQIPP